MDPDSIIAPPNLLSAFQVPRDCSVAQLLAWPNTPPRPRSHKYDIPALHWFSDKEPTLRILESSEILLPSSQNCVALDSRLREACTNGARSVQHPVKNDVYLPLWIVRVWKWGDGLLRAQEVWRDCLAWVEKAAKREKWGEEMAARIRNTVLSCPQMTGFAILQNGGVSSSTLAKNLLSNAWLNDESMNCLLDVFTHNMRSSNASPATSTASVYLRTSLKNPNSTTHRHYANKLASGAVDKLLMPCNIQNVHWIAVEVDVTAKIISIGDSSPKFSRGDLPGLLAEIRGFLAPVYPNASWRVNQSALETGLQVDGTSCGIASLNAIERRIFPNAPAWSPSAPAFMRAVYFERCVTLGSQVSLIILKWLH